MDSKVYQAFLTLEKATYVDGALSKKEKELIATAISVINNCESCMQWHITEAAKAGATEKEVLEALEVAFEMGGGPATVHGRFALEVMDTIFHEAPSVSPSQDPCCS
ncbi:carboxymuconolactone decarboxylase family protein [bacterium]|nr:carboxymuconolactone decarboxylase family protein [bacterium]